jgi:NADPH2:quinone reductase
MSVELANLLLLVLCALLRPGVQPMPAPAQPRTSAALIDQIEQGGSMRAITVTRTGGPEVLEPAELPAPEPGDDQVLVRVAAAGVNFIDTYQRSGLYPAALPLVPGLEGAGTVTAVGRAVLDLAPGDRVSWGDVPGSYAEQVIVPAGRAVRVPEGVTSEQATAVMLQGLTAHYLVHDSFALGPGHRCLVHAGAGGVGQLLIQLAHRIGAEVFTTVGSPEKAELARAAGADHVILYRDEDFGDAVERIAGPHPLDVVYDGLGQLTFLRGLDLLRVRGTMVTFGNATGPVEPLSPLTLSRKGSLFLTRPTLAHHIETTDELRTRSAELMQQILAGTLAIGIGSRYPLVQARDAHTALEGRETTGKVLLMP